MTNTPEEIKALAVRKLREFRKWWGYAGYPAISYDADYRFTPTPLTYPPFDGKKLTPELAKGELETIKAAIGNLPDIRYRQILILAYLVPEKLTVEAIRIQIMRSYKPNKPVKSSQYHALKNKALLTFAKLYRDGLLETWSE